MILLEEEGSNLKMNTITSYHKSLTPEQLAYYSFKGHILFDKECETIEDVFSCIHMTIVKEFTTADFELEKYLWFKKDIFVFYICKYFGDRLHDWKHIIVSAIYNHSDKDVLFMLLLTYEKNHGKPLEVDPSKDDILYSVFLSHNFTALQQLIVYSKIDAKWTSIMTHTNKKMDEVRDCYLAWDIRDATNPRNLFYAIFKEDIETAIFLLDNGARADVWNNQLMNRVLSKPHLRKNNDLVKRMLTGGASLKTMKKTDFSHCF